MLKAYLNGQNLHVMLLLLFGVLMVPHPLQGLPIVPLLTQLLRSKTTTLHHSTTCYNSSLDYSQETLSLRPLTLYPLIGRIWELSNHLKHFPKSKRERGREIVSELFIKKIQVYK